MQKPLTSRTTIQIQIGIILILSLLAGYFQSKFELEQKKYLRLEDRYVRLRQVLGREEIQRLIDLSYEEIIPD